MTLASSGLISLGGSTSGRSVNLELGNSATATIVDPSTAIRSLTGVASGPVVLPNDFWGKSAFTPSLADITGQSFTAFFSTVGVYPVLCNVTFNTNGTWVQTDNDGPQISGNWGTPTTTGVGAGYWIKFTQTASTGSGGSATSTTGWLQLNSAQTVTVSKTNSGTLALAVTYTIQIATDSAGSNVVATATGVVLTSSRA